MTITEIRDRLVGSHRGQLFERHAFIREAERELAAAERLHDEVRRFLAKSYVNTENWPEIAACLKGGH